MSELEDRLRAELRRRAEAAPGSTLLAERIIAAARTQPRPAGRGWPTWTLPLLAAAAVAAIISGVFVGVSQLRTDGAPGPALSKNGTFRPTAVNTAPTQAPTPSSSVAPSATASASTTPPPDNSVGVHNFVATDLTFVGTEDGWAIGNADCLVGPGTCQAMVRTTDAGKSWHSMPTPFDGVTGIRFATDQTGYAYSDSGFAMTTNGGATWTRESGGAVALETFDNNVIRVQVSPPGGCPPGCRYTVSTAPIGSDSWAPATLSGGSYAGDGVELVRSNRDAYLLVFANPASGAGTAWSTLFSSHDDGASWTRHDDPCAVPADKEADSVAIAASPGGVTALCQVRAAGTGRDFFVVSRNAGADFTAEPGTIPQFTADQIAGDPTTVLAAAGTGAYLSTNGGTSWQLIPEISGKVSFVGFESQTLGRIVTDGGRTIWTTTDGGTSWTPYTFPS